MKPSKAIRRSNRADRSVAWWSTLLLIALGAVLTALFLSGRMLLSLEEPRLERTRVPGTFATASPQSVLPSRDTERLGTAAFGRYHQYW